jgi:lysophospholipase L1-like esterase
MKEILCFGDSNTWGYSPHTFDRYPRDVRWTGVLQMELGPDYHVIEEGLNARTTVWDDPIEGVGSSKNGRAYLIPCLESHKPLDLVIIKLGTNDLKYRFSVTATDIANSAGTLVDVVKNSQAGRGNSSPAVLLIAPPPLGRLTDFAEMFKGGVEKSKEFAVQFRRVAQEKGCAFLDAGQILTCSEADGLHYDPEGHRALGLAVARKVKEILG